MSQSYVDTIGRWGQGNIDLNNRIVVHNPNGSISTELSFTVGIDNEVVLLPSIVNGVILSDEAAIQHYLDTGEYLGKFTTDAAADAYAEALHLRQEWFYTERVRDLLQYNEIMGIQVTNNGVTTTLPDPSSWTYQVGDLDTSGGRDATGYLHRAYVASKINYEFEWHGLEWEKLAQILAAINSPKFTLKAPDPRTFQDTYTGQYYVGDRTGKNHYYIPEKPNIALFDLKLKFIEY